MACRDDQIGKKCKQRFKGIETFLRRVAFNLGNSPSQTEVKIISCIPIDVTDLQQKIIHLEKQLEEMNSIKRASMTVPPQTVAAAHVTGDYSARSSATNTGCCSRLPHVSACCSKPQEPTVERKSAVSFTLHTDKPSPVTVNTAIPTDAVEPKERRPIRKTKKALKKNTHMVYYAETIASPFTEFQKNYPVKTDLLNTDTIAYRPSLTELICKQYRSERLGEQTEGSQLSAPVCRDAPRAQPCASGWDVCSCCRGRFHDIDLDKYTSHFEDATDTYRVAQNTDHDNNFYNSSYYDLIPEKEKPDKLDKEYERLRKRVQKIPYANCWTENYYTKPDYHSLKKKYAVPSPTNTKKPAVKYPKRKDLIKRNVSCRDDPSINTIVECGDVYMKHPVLREPTIRPLEPRNLLKDVECLTRSFHNTECQTESNNNNEPAETPLPAPEQNKTESTLNQIKSILQSVLTQVKTNNQVKNQVEDKAKKDAIVQKEAQSNEEGCSRLLNSYTYNPFAVNPYMTSCSRGLPSEPCSVMQQSWSMPQQVSDIAPAHFKCMQNFPVLIQHRPVRQQCSKCHRTGVGMSKPAQPKQTSTSTLPQPGLRQNETENLIKEIYKSVALNIDVPTNEVSQSEYNNIKSVNVSTNESREPIISNMMMVNRAKNEKRYAREPPVSTATTSRATSDTRSPLTKSSGDQRATRGRYIPTLLRRRTRKCRIHDTDTSATREHKTSRVVRQVPVEASDSASETETDTQSAHVSVPIRQPIKKEPEKKGVLSKMFGSVFKKRRRKEKQEEYDSDGTEQSEASDSDDYQTIYSQKIQRPQKRVSYAPERRKPSSHRSVPRALRSGRRAPYMEQEYRRAWDERLMFHSQQPARFSLERSPRGTVRSRPPGIYFQHFETRPALVTPPRPYPRPVTRPHVPQCPNKPPSRPPKKILGTKLSSKKLSWLKKHRFGIHCGEQWKKLILEG